MAFGVFRRLQRRFFLVVPIFRSFRAISPPSCPKGTRIVEAGETVASELDVVLKNNALLNNDSDKSPVVRYIATDNMSRFLSVGQFFLGEKIDHVELVQIGGAGADKIEKVGKSGSGPIGSGKVVSRDSLTFEPREYL